MEPSVTVTFSNLSPAQAQNLFASLRCDYHGPAPSVEPAVHTSGYSQVADPAHPGESLSTAGTAGVSKKRGRPRKDEAAAPAPSADPPPAVTHTLNDVRTAMAELSSKKGLDECRVLLGKFGANRVGELDTAKYAEFIKACAV